MAMQYHDFVYAEKKNFTLTGNLTKKYTVKT